MTKCTVKAGLLRHRVILQSLVPVQDPVTGIVTNSWVDFATVWASVEPLSAREFVAAQALQSKVELRLQIRYISGVLPSMRVVHGTAFYNIEGVLPDRKSGREMLTLPASRAVYG